VGGALLPPKRAVTQVGATKFVFLRSYFFGMCSNDVMRLAHQLAEGKNIPHRFNTNFIEERKRNGTHLKSSKDFLARTGGLINRRLYNKTLEAIGLYRGTKK
jgi:hypothetical protein